MRRVSRLIALAGLLATLAVAVPALGQSFFDTDDSRVSCTHAATTARTTVRVHPVDLNEGIPPSIAEEIGPEFVPGSVSLQRRGDAIAVLPGDLSNETPVRCKGGPVTVANTDLIRIQSTGGEESPFVFLDLRYGLFAPGATAEPDGSSEIEIEMREPRTLIWVRGTREADAMQATTTVAGSALSVTGPESASDPEIAAPGQSLYVLDAAGSDDTVTFSSPSGARPKWFAIAFGGQGRDRLTGLAGADLLAGGPGADVIDAGPGSDFVVSTQGARDLLDCGSGDDTAIIHGDPRITSCENVILTPRVPIRDVGELFGVFFQPVVQESEPRPGKLTKRLRQLQLSR
jgi:hypothetical protein